MATLEQLQDALINADKAGDTEAARVLADEIARLQSTQQPQQAAETQLGADRRMANDAQVAEQTAVGRRETYDQKPWYSQALQAADDEARLLASGMSFGFGDKFSAAMNSMTGDKPYEDQLRVEREATQAARDRAASAALPSEIAGSVMSGSLAANSGATLAGRLGTGAMDGWRGVLARAGLMAPEGAVYGTLDALGNDKDVKTGAITGAIAAPIGSVIGDAVSKVASKVLPAKTASKVPTPEKIRKLADDAYTAADNAGVVVNPQSMQRLRANVQKELTDFGYHPQNHPGVKVALDEIDRIANGNVTLKGVDTLRKIARRGYNPGNPENNAGLEIVVKQIDDLVNGLKTQDIVTGNVKDGVKALNDARKMWTRVRKYEKFSDAVESAQLRAASTGSGGNAENATRQELRRFIDPKLKSAPKNWTPDEAEALKGIVKGTLSQNTLRLFGKLSPQGNGLTATAHLLAVLPTGGMSIPIAGLGMGSKYLADRGVRQGVQALDELIRAGGSKAQLQAAQATLRSLSQSQREAIGRIVQMSIIQSRARTEEPAQ